MTSRQNAELPLIIQKLITGVTNYSIAIPLVMQYSVIANRLEKERKKTRQSSGYILLP
jgi:ethanolamine transporter EutH